VDKLTRNDLMSLEEYAVQRSEFRARVLAHKSNRQVALGEHVTLYFEDALTMRYQIQEMLRVERIFEPDAIQEELDSYNPLIPDGTNWKCTFMIEYDDVEERRAALERMRGIEDRVWVQVQGFPPSWAIADEDLDRENDTKTSAVHFLRFELTADAIAAVESGSAIAMGIDHDAYRVELPAIPDAVRKALAADLQ